METTPLRREVLEGGRVKGGLMAAHVRWIADHKTPDDVTRFRASLPPGLREDVETGIKPTQWYRFTDLIALDRSVVDLFGGGMPTLLRELGAYSARLNLNGSTGASVHDFLEGCARYHSQFQDFGTAAYVRTGASSGRMVHTKYASFSPLYCESGVGFYREAVALHGFPNASVIETDCQCRGRESCTFVIRWR